jgi:hypothetical protein
MILALSGTGAARDVHYLDFHSNGALVSIEVNGFQLFHSKGSGGGSFSIFLDPYLIKGKNVVTFGGIIPPNESGQPTGMWVDCQVAKAPSDAPRTQSGDEIIFSKRLDPVRSFRLSRQAPESYAVSLGDLNVNNSALTFGPTGERRWGFGVKLVGDDPSLRLPEKIALPGLSQTLAKAEVHLVGPGTGNHLVFSDLKFSRGGEPVSLDPAKISRGALVADGSKFTSLWIFGFSADGVSEVKALDLELVSTPSPIRERHEFNVDLPNEWSWQDAARLENDEGQQVELVTFLKELHRVLDQEEAEKWLPFFEPKTRDFATATGKSLDEVRQSQLSFFQSLTKIEGWGLAPFDDKRLLITPVNEKIVEVAYIDTIGPLISRPVLRPGSDRFDRFKIPLYLSKIDGSWKVVR